MRDGTSGGERLSDGAELAAGADVGVANAVLKHRRGENVVRVKLRDFPVGNAIVGEAPVELRLRRKAQRPHAVPTPVEKSLRAPFDRFRGVG